MSNIKYIVIGLIISLLISLFFNFKQFNTIQSIKLETYNNSLLYNSNKLLIDSLNVKISKRDIKLDSLLFKLKNTKNQDKITRKYDKVYKTINNYPDSIKLEELLSMHRQLKIQRN